MCIGYNSVIIDELKYRINYSLWTAMLNLKNKPISFRNRKYWESYPLMTMKTFILVTVFEALNKVNVSQLKWIFLMNEINYNKNSYLERC